MGLLGPSQDFNKVERNSHNTTKPYSQTASQTDLNKKKNTTGYVAP